MENLVGKTVWVVEFFDKDFVFCDCNGVYASREKARAAIEDEFHRNEGYWVNRTLVFDNGSNRCESFYSEDLEVEICVGEDYIQ